MENQWMSLLSSIVNVNSGTGNRAGSEEVRRLLIPHFESLGFTHHTERVGENHAVLSFDFPGANPTLALVGHLDTVFPVHSKFHTMTTSSDRVIGPGVIDMKGGIVLFLNILNLLKSRVDLRKVRVIINDDEEIGSPHSNAHLKDLGKGVPYGLVFEPGLPDRSVVNSEAGVYWLELVVKGRAAHSGLEHKTGVNAASELAHKIVKLSSLTDYERNVTLNVGTLSGGIAPNVVCDEARAKIDIRYVDPKDLELIQARLDQVRKESTVRSANSGEPTSAEFNTLALVPSFCPDQTLALMPFFNAASQKTGQSIECKHVGYTSDANHLAQTGMNLLVGLGPYGGGMHTQQEFMLLESYSERLKFGESLIQEILGGHL